MRLFETLMSEGFEIKTQPDMGFAMKTPVTAINNMRGFNIVRLGQGMNREVVESKLRG
jgi:hypothetical protein